MSFTNLQDHFLIAMPKLQDINFNRSVIYICAHNKDGAMGMMINHPLIDINLGEVMKQMDIQVTQKKTNQLPVLLGGPVLPERGFILHKKEKAQQWDSSLMINDEIVMTSSQDILEALAKNQGPKEFLTLLGYAGWDAEQLEKEIIENDWLVAPAQSHLIFETPFEERWEQAANLIGVDINNLSDEVGHA